MLSAFLRYGWASSPERIVLALAVTAGFALAARALRGVSRSGMAAGAASCFLLFAGAGPSAFAALVALFALTWATTKLGYTRKQELGVAERGDGRNATQVLANLAVPALCSIAFPSSASGVCFVAMTAPLAEAGTDTLATEIGQSRTRTPILVTTWKRVPAGTDGGITFAGTLAGMIAGLLISAVTAWVGMIPSSLLWIPTVAGFAGMLVDSLLGATVQRRHWTSNEAVNFFGTVI